MKSPEYLDSQTILGLKNFYHYSPFRNSIWKMVCMHLIKNDMFPNMSFASVCKWNFFFDWKYIFVRGIIIQMTPIKLCTDIFGKMNRGINMQHLYMRHLTYWMPIHYDTI